MRNYVEAVEARAKYGEHALTLTERALLRQGPPPTDEDEEEDGDG